MGIPGVPMGVSARATKGKRRETVRPQIMRGGVEPWDLEGEIPLREELYGGTVCGANQIAGGSASTATECVTSRRTVPRGWSGVSAACASTSGTNPQRAPPAWSVWAPRTSRPTTATRSANKRCHNCGRNGHWCDDCPERGAPVPVPCVPPNNGGGWQPFRRYTRML